MHVSERSVDPVAAIEELYVVAQTPRPTAARPITPLGNLIDASGSLVHEPVRGLTLSSALSFLLQRGALAEAPELEGVSALAGFLYANAAGGIILVEATDLVVRRRFSAAHELGHYVLHVCPALRSTERGDRFEVLEGFPGEETEPGSLPAATINLFDAGDKTSWPLSLEEMEREADGFAAALLMPEDVISALAVQHSGRFRDEDLVWRLSTDMLVSRMAMRLRMRNLSLIAPNVSWN